MWNQHIFFLLHSYAVLSVCSSHKILIKYIDVCGCDKMMKSSQGMFTFAKCCASFESGESYHCKFILFSNKNVFDIEDVNSLIFIHFSMTPFHPDCSSIHARLPPEHISSGLLSVPGEKSWFIFYCKQ